MNGARNLPTQKPVQGQEMMDAAGNRYKVTQVGLRYVKAINLKNGEEGMVKIQSLFPAPVEPKPTLQQAIRDLTTPKPDPAAQSAQEEFES